MGHSIFSYLTALAFLLVGYLIQNFIVYPIETLFRSAESVALYSYMYLPHGLKAITFAILGVWAVPLNFIAQTLAGVVVYGTETVRAMESAMLGTASFLAGLYLLNFSIGRSLGGGLIKFEFHQKNRLSLVVYYGIIVTFVNASVSALYWPSNEAWLSLRFMAGDFCGAMVSIGALIVARHYIWSTLRSNAS